jgi:NAD(P)-dependent dehydrogenase (short-subunit alcohol dehydrogenase family)
MHACERVAIVTGAGRGLGRAYALALAAAGTAVVVNDTGTAGDGSGVDAAVAARVVDEVRAAGGLAIANVDPVGTVAAGEALVAAAIDAFGRVDVLVNNAGISESHPLDQFPAQAWDRILAVHLTGTFACARAAFAVMRAAGRGGRIVNVTSGAGLDRVYAGTAAYAAAKGGIVSLTRVIAAEGAACGITCNAVAPLARTRMSARFLADATSPELDPAWVAPLVVYLASAESVAITGEVFRVREGRLSTVRLAPAEGVAPIGARWSAAEIAARIDDIRGPVDSK